MHKLNYHSTLFLHKWPVHDSSIGGTVYSFAGESQAEAVLKNVECRVDVGSMWARWGVDVGSMWGQCGVDIGSMRDRCGVDVGSMWGRCRVDRRSMYLWMLKYIESTRRWRWRRENNKIVEEEGNQDWGGKIIQIVKEGIKNWGKLKIKSKIKKGK